MYGMYGINLHYVHFFLQLVFAHFLLGSVSGEITCLGANEEGCGVVLQEHIIAQGAERRNHEGEEVQYFYCCDYILFGLYL